MAKQPPIDRAPASLCSFRAAVLILILGVHPASGRELRFHGPVLQWHEDPTTSVSFSWVEEVEPEAVPGAGWRKGISGFGYGDDDDVTVLGDMRNRYRSVYLAKEFNVPSAGGEGVIDLGIRYDDAFIAYINGVEVVRSRNISGRSADAKVMRSHEAGAEERFRIPNGGSFLKQGRNVIAVEGHNARVSSTDFTLAPRLYHNGRELIASGEEWHYLAGGVPPEGWTRDRPKETRGRQPAMEKVSDWELFVRPRFSGAAYLQTKPEKRPFGSSDHMVLVAKATGLVPGTAYEYALVAGRQWVKSGWFRTAPAVLDGPMRFIVGGDMGTHEAVPMSRVVGRDDPLFVAVGGDLAYANGRSHHLWFDWLDNWNDLVLAPDGRSIPIIAAIGNHETRSFSGLDRSELWKGLAYLNPKKSRAPLYYALFDLPGGDSNFTVDISNYLSLIVLDSGHSQKVSGQTGWLGRELGKRQDVRHLFAIYHDPAWGAGIKSNNRDIQKQWCPLFEKYQPDCVFENDHHCYKRSHPIVSGRRNEERGIRYMGDGAWGAALRPITEKGLNRSGARHYLAEWRSVNHVIRVTIFPGGGRKYEAIDRQRNVFDSVVDTKTRRGGMADKPRKPSSLKN